MITAEIELTAGGGTIDLSNYAPATVFLITGNATLTSNWTIEDGAPVESRIYQFLIDATIDLNGNNVTLLGTGLSSEMVNKPTMFYSKYNGSGNDNYAFVDYSDTDWVTDSKIKNGAIITAKLDTGAVTSDKIGSGAVVADKLGASERFVPITIPLSFDTNELGGGYQVYFPFDCEVVGAFFSVTKAIAATDAATAPFTITAGTPTPSSPISFPASSAIGYNFAISFSGTIAVSAGDVGTFTTAKPTPGGKALATLWVRRT